MVISGSSFEDCTSSLCLIKKDRESIITQRNSRDIHDSFRKVVFYKLNYKIKKTLTAHILKNFCKSKKIFSC